MTRRVTSRCRATAYLPVAPTFGASLLHSKDDQQSSNLTTHSLFETKTSVTVAVTTEPIGNRALMDNHSWWLRPVDR